MRTLTSVAKAQPATQDIAPGPPAAPHVPAESPGIEATDGSPSDVGRGLSLAVVQDRVPAKFTPETALSHGTSQGHPHGTSKSGRLPVRELLRLDSTALPHEHEWLPPVQRQLLTSLATESSNSPEQPRSLEQWRATAAPRLAVLAQGAVPPKLALQHIEELRRSLLATAAAAPAETECLNQLELRACCELAILAQSQTQAADLVPEKNAALACFDRSTDVLAPARKHAFLATLAASAGKSDVAIEQQWYALARTLGTDRVTLREAIANPTVWQEQVAPLVNRLAQSGSPAAKTLVAQLCAPLVDAAINSEDAAALRGLSSTIEALGMKELRTVHQIAKAASFAIEKDWASAMRCLDAADSTAANDAEKVYVRFVRISLLQRMSVELENPTEAARCAQQMAVCVSQLPGEPLVSPTKRAELMFCVCGAALRAHDGALALASIQQLRAHAASHGLTSFVHSADELLSSAHRGSTEATLKVFLAMAQSDTLGESMAAMAIGAGVGAVLAGTFTLGVGAPLGAMIGMAVATTILKTRNVARGADQISAAARTGLTTITHGQTVINGLSFGLDFLGVAAVPASLGAKGGRLALTALTRTTAKGEARALLDSFIAKAARVNNKMGAQLSRVELEHAARDALSTMLTNKVAGFGGRAMLRAQVVAFTEPLVQQIVGTELDGQLTREQKDAAIAAIVIGLQKAPLAMLMQTLMGKGISGARRVGSQEFRAALNELVASQPRVLALDANRFAERLEAAIPTNASNSPHTAAIRRSGVFFDPVTGDILVDSKLLSASREQLVGALTHELRHSVFNTLPEVQRLKLQEYAAARLPAQAETAAHATLNLQQRTDEWLAELSLTEWAQVMGTVAGRRDLTAARLSGHAAHLAERVTTHGDAVVSSRPYHATSGEAHAVGHLHEVTSPVSRTAYDGGRLQLERALTAGQLNEAALVNWMDSPSFRLDGGVGPWKDLLELNARGPQSTVVWERVRAHAQASGKMSELSTFLVDGARDFKARAAEPNAYFDAPGASGRMSELALRYQTAWEQLNQATFPH